MRHSVRKAWAGASGGERGAKRSVRCHAGGNVIRRLSAQVSASSKERASLGDAGGSRLLLLGLLLVQELLERPDDLMMVGAHVTCESPLLVCRVASSSVCVAHSAYHTPASSLEYSMGFISCPAATTVVSDRNRTSVFGVCFELKR